MSKVNLTEEEQKVIESSVSQIRKILNSKNVDLKNIVGAVSTENLKDTKDAIEVRFLEDGEMMSQMNMVAFD